MQKTLYQLVHYLTREPFKTYATVSGARIAQRQRNHRLGFHTRINRHTEGDLELEICENSENQTVTATWCIREITVDSEADILEY